jgi:hypothetical protein
LLKSLFGDLATPAGQGAPTPGGVPEFAATAILETHNTEVTDQGKMVDRRQEDVYFSGSPGAAIREHLERTPADPNVRLVTMLDPSRMWAPGVIKALSDATGQPVERLHLRDEDSEQLRVTLERTSVPRRAEPTLKIYHADVAADDTHHLEAPLALMEHSHMAAVIVGAMTVPEIVSLVSSLLRAVREPRWRCGTLLFLLPPGQLGLATRLTQIDWPKTLRVEVFDEPLTGTSSVWNALLGAWDRAMAPPPSADAQAPRSPVDSASMPLSGLTGASAASASATRRPSTLPVRPAAPEARAASLPARQPQSALQQATQHAALVQRHLRDLALMSGVLHCGLAQVQGGELVFGLRSPTAPAPEADVSAVASALAAVAHANQSAVQALGPGDAPQEVVLTSEQSVCLMRPCVHNPQHFLFARVKRHQGNLAMIKLQLAETDRALIVAASR